MGWLVALAIGVVLILFGALTIVFVQVITASARADHLLQRKGLFGYSDVLIKEREEQQQREEWDKNHPRDPHG